MKPTDDITNTLRRHRLLAGDLTQPQLADLAGVSRQTIVMTSSYQRRRPAPATLVGGILTAGGPGLLRLRAEE